MTPGNLSHWLWDRVADLGVRHVFAMPAGHIKPLSDALAARHSPKAVVTTTELGAGYMAEGQARVTTRPGVVLVGGGPGTANVLPSATNARLELTPVIYLSGAEAKPGRGFRAFQDTGPEGSRDMALMTLACGHSQTMTPVTAGEVWATVAARAATQLPVHVALSKATQGAPAPRVADTVTPREAEAGRDAALNRIAAFYAEARSPVLVVGPRLLSWRDCPAFDRLLRVWGGTIVTSVAAAGMLPDDTPGYLGNFGHGGQPSANAGVAAGSGLVLFIGASPGQRDGVDWASQANALARIDVTGAAECCWNGPQVLTSDLATAIDDLSVRLEQTGRRRKQATKPSLRSQAVKLPFDAYLIEAQRLLPAEMPVFADAGTHRRSIARLWQGCQAGMVHSSAEHAPMGWGIAAAIGAALALDAPVLCVTGDGSMRLMGQEIATASRYGARVLFLVANNAGFASLTISGRDCAMMGHFGESDRVDWAAFATVLSAGGCRVAEVAALEPALRTGLARPGPFVVDVTLPAICPATSWPLSQDCP